MSPPSLWSIIVVLLTLLTSYSVSKTAKTCHKVALDSQSSVKRQHLEGTPVTRIGQSEDCSDGHFQWSPLTRRENSYIVQFTKNHEPFVLCLHNGNNQNSSSSNLSLFHLKGSSQRVVPNLSIQQGGKECIRSHCNHITLLVKSNTLPLKSRPHKLSYSLLSDNICSRCSDNCMETILCSSDYIFIGTVRKVTHEKSNSGFVYKSQVLIEKYIRYNNTYTSSRLSHCSRSPTQYAMDSEYPIQKAGGLVSLISKCRLKEGKRYFIGANLKLGYLSKPKLILGCGQEDINYMLYQFDKLLLHSSSSNSCC